MSQGLEALLRQQGQIQDQLSRLQQSMEARDERIGALAGQQARLQDELRGELRGKLDGVSQVVETLASRQAELQAKLDGTHGPALQAAREQIARAERKLRRILHSLDDGERESGPAVSAPKIPGSRRLEPEFDYAGFEERFRGSEKTIKTRQRVYVEDFKGRESVLEIGCGRGEFLELLREAGVAAKGVDLDLDMTLYCREKGLDVVREDALASLESLPDDSLGGVFSSQVIEHLETSQLTRLVSLCHRKLRSAGVLVFETLNPECLLVLYRWFCIDLGHVRLVHPETLKFLLESVGFGQIECRFLPPGDTPVTIPPWSFTGWPSPSWPASTPRPTTSTSCSTRAPTTR